MRWLRSNCGGCDGLDVAAVWPSSASVAGFPLPEISVPSKGEQPEMEEKKETL
jgi:hypothetical protein